MRRPFLYSLVAIALAAIAFVVSLGIGLPFEMRAAIIALVGVGVLVIGYIRYLSAKRTERTFASVGVVEDLPPIITPGDDLDQRWDEYRFEAIVIGVVADANGCTEEEAINQLRDGSWTDDPIAAAYFSRQPPPNLGSTRSWWSSIFRQPPDRTTQRRHAASEIATLIGLDEGDRG